MTAISKKGAPAGNQFWQLRSKHGRDKLYKTPELMWEAACEYFQWAKDNPWVKNEAVKSGDSAGMIIQVPTERPITLHGLCLYLGCSTSYFRAFKLSLKEKDKDFLTILTRIEETIYAHKFEGAAVGAFNASIIARDLGLTEAIDVTTAGEKVTNFTFTVVKPGENKEIEG